MIEIKMSPDDQGMGWLEWSSAIIGSLAWPVAAVIIALAFRRQIAELLSKVRKLSWGDKVVDLTDQLDKAEATAAEAKAESIADQPQDESGEASSVVELPDLRFQQLLTISPAAAVLEAWRPIEAKLLAMSAVSDLAGKARSPYLVAKLLHDTKRISDSTYHLLREMQHVRNAAVHASEVSPVDAIRFISLAQEAARALDRADRKMHISDVRYS